MGVPEADKAEISETKIVRYLLSPTHPVGRSKAGFFGKHGFNVKNWRTLASALRRHAAENVVASVRSTPYGARYVVDGPLAAPDGSTLNVRSVWFISETGSIPRFATAHPLKRNSP